MSLSRDHAHADDLVQETMLKAWSKSEQFKPDSNIGAWLFTILRNTFRSDMRKRSREVADVDGLDASKLATTPEHNGMIEFQDFIAALASLPDRQRQALILVGVAGCSYERAGEICNCAVGTMKSRVSRARVSTAADMAIDDPGEIGLDSTSLATIGYASPAGARSC